MASTKGYRGYHGRTKGKKRLLIALLCLILLGAVGFLIAQRYIVYEADGGIHFALPWNKEKKPETTPSPDGKSSDEDLEIIVEPPSQTGQDQLHVRELETAVLRGSMDTVLASMEDSAFNAVAIQVKNSRGEIVYNSQIKEAIDAGAVAGGSIARAALEEMFSSEYYTIARIATLHDSIYSFAHMADAAVIQLQHPGYIWYDPDSTFYLAAEKELARQYIVEIAKECASMGFDELLFDEFTYPPTGRLSNIDTTARTMSQSEALVLLAQEIREGVKGDEALRLSVSLDAQTVLAGENEKTGQIVSELAEQFDRIYVETEPSEIPALQQALEPYSAEFVPIVSQALTEGNYLVKAS